MPIHERYIVFFNKAMRSLKFANSPQKKKRFVCILRSVGPGNTYIDGPIGRINSLRTDAHDCFFTKINVCKTILVLMRDKRKGAG